MQSSESLDIFRRRLKTELIERSYNWHCACQTTLLLRDSLSLSRSFLLWLQPWSLSTIMLLWYSFCFFLPSFFEGLIIIIIIPNTALAAPAAFVHRLLDFRVLSMITPKSLFLIMGMSDYPQFTPIWSDLVIRVTDVPSAYFWHYFLHTHRYQQSIDTTKVVILGSRHNIVITKNYTIMQYNPSSKTKVISIQLFQPRISHDE